MAIVVRPADLRADKHDFVEFLSSHLSPQADGKRYEWLYWDSPFGQAQAWVAVDQKTQRIVGAAAAFPRRMYQGPTEILTCVLGDFCIHPGYRSLGPALQLQRACLAVVNAASFRFCYDFPSTSMMAIYGTLKIMPYGKFVRFAMPLRAERKIQAVVGSATVARALAVPVNFVLGRRGRNARTGSFEIGMYTETYSEEFTELDRTVQDKRGLRTVRTADYLNWRYRAHPSGKHETVIARERGRLCGYCIFRQASDAADIVDLFSTGEPHIIAQLLRGTADVLRKRGVATISMAAFEQHPWRRVFEKAGFQQREHAPVILYPQRETTAFGSRLYLMQGDRDI